VYRGQSLARTDQLRETDHIPEVLLKDYQRLLGSQPARRYNPKKLVENSSLFANKLVETITFLDNLTLKDSIEKAGTRMYVSDWSNGFLRYQTCF